MVRPVVHSIKHYTQFSIFTVTGGAAVSKSVVSAVAPEDVNDADEVVEGSLVKAVYLELWVRSATTTGSSGQMVFFKKQAGQADPSTTNMAALHDWTNKKNIFYTTMGLFNDVDADAVVAFKGWIKIPKGKQRMGLGDFLNFTFFAPTIDLHVCGFATYKEYS